MEKLKLGVIVSTSDKPEESIKEVKKFDLSTCQIACWDEKYLNPNYAKLLKNIANENGVEITTIWVGWPGPGEWNFIHGPLTLGLVPTAYREKRLEVLKKGSDFARDTGVNSITTHVGFIPENPNDPAYPELIVALINLVRYCKANNQYFCFETGQETPVTLLRTIQDISEDNVGINLDPANLIMYGKASPVDSLDVFGKYVKGVHAKDGVYPTTGRELGKEMPLGSGKVNFPVFIQKLKDLGYRGALTIEREISGPQQIEDIKKAIKFLQVLI